MQKNAKMTTRLITFTAMMTALVMVSGFIPPLNIPPIGRIYWCDGIIFLGCFLFAPLPAAIIGGVGTFLYDLLLGNVVMMCASLVIHGLQAFLVSFLFHKIFPKKKHEPIFAFSAALVGAAVVIAGYFVTRVLLQNRTLEYALIRIPSDVIQEAVGIAAALLVTYGFRLKVALAKSGLLPEIAVKKDNSGEEASTEFTTTETPASPATTAPTAATVSTTATETTSATETGSQTDKPEIQEENEKKND